MTKIQILAQKIWDYHHVYHVIENTDCILVLGSSDVRVAERGAQLFLEKYAPLLIFSGGLGRLTKDIWHESEALKFANIAIGMGVPKDKILIEDKSTNTGENILFTKKLILEKKLDIQKFILVQKPYMERRTYATFKKSWPEKDCIVTSPQVSFSDYCNDKIKEDDVINIMVGDLQRIRIYPERGFQIFQIIPEDVWDAYEELVKLGYDKQLIRN